MKIGAASASRVGYARGIKIEHNEVSDCSYTGISVGWGWTKMTNALRDNFIHANRVHHVATRLSDTAGIYTLVRATRHSRQRELRVTTSK